MIEPQQNDKPVSEWNDEQRRLGGAWARHEVQHRFDRMCAPYDWKPAWTSLTADDIYDGMQFYYFCNSTRQS